MRPAGATSRPVEEVEVAVVVRVPSPLRHLVQGAATVSVEASDVGAVLAALEDLHPGTGDRLLDGDGHVHRFVHLFLGDTDVRDLAGLDTPVGDGDVLSIVPSVARG